MMVLLITMVTHGNTKPILVVTRYCVVDCAMSCSNERCGISKPLTH